MNVKHNKYAAEVRTPKYRMRVVTSKKVYKRKIKHKKSA